MVNNNSDQTTSNNRHKLQNTKQPLNYYSKYCRKYYSLLFISLLFFNTLLINVAHAANISAQVSRNPIALDSTFQLSYEADSSVDGDPDFSPIYNDFDVLSTSQSTNMRYVNGDWSLNKTWQLTLFAKAAGDFTIPPISFGIDVAPAIDITVTSDSTAKPSTPKDPASIPAQIFLEGSVDKKTGWIHSQFIYTVRLLRTVNITGASLSEPQTSDSNVIIHRISEDQYQTTRDGIEYDVIERRYALFPQHSGNLIIYPVTFQGRINAIQPRTIFDQFKLSGQLKRLRNKSVGISVKPVPENINLQDWLPTSELQLIDEWSTDIQNITAGEPVTRTILISAEGLTAVQLPDMQFEDIDGLRQYPDKPIIEDEKSSNGIIGYKQFKIAYIPARAGSFTLPEIRLPWWNTTTNKQEIARLAETVITVQAANNADGTLPPASATTQMPLHENGLPDNATSDDAAAQPVTIVPGEVIYWKGLSALFAIAWLVTLAFLLKKTKGGNTKNKHKTNNSQSIAQSKKAVQKYAKNNDAARTKTALIQWAQRNFQNNKLNNLSEISQHCSTPLSEQIRLLNQALYSPKNAEWHGKELLLTFKKEPAEKNQQHKTDTVLKPLYNSHT